MALNLDVSKLTQSAAAKATPHDNCVVLDLGTGTFPRDIEVRLPDDDGARQNALWDGSLNLSVNDEVLCFEYSGLSAWRVMGMGGNDGGAGKVRVSEVWESDFGAVALQSDADGNIGIGTAGPDAKLEALTTAGAQLRLTSENEVKFADFTVDANHNLAIDPTSTGEIKLNATVTVLDEIQRKGDADTKIGFADDKFSLTVGNLLMLEATEIAGQDTLALGDAAGGGDVDVNFNDGQMFFQGSDGSLSIGTSDNTYVLQGIPTAGNFFINRGTAGQRRTAVFSGVGSQFPENVFLRARGGPSAVANGDTIGDFFFCGHDGTDYNRSVRIRVLVDGAVAANTVPMAISLQTSQTNTIGIAERMRIAPNGRISIGNVATPLAQLHIDQSNGAAAIPVLTLDQADVSEPFTKYIGTAAAATLTQSIVDDGDVTTATLVGWTKIEIDDVGNQVADGDYFQPFYTLA
ncbi:hypothetical protein LCGC14_0928490 [marine sediment metagenome]|uniref:Uncharacterized protein n=1 Tax=marine sediment metagenome TaxID=412755 RepID=A0A0F9R764_9ZZZZ